MTPPVRQIYVCRDGQDIGDWPEDQFQAKIFSGELFETDWFFYEGMTDWQRVREYRRPEIGAWRRGEEKTPNGLSRTGVNQITASSQPIVEKLKSAFEIKRGGKKQSAAETGGACALVAAFAPLLHPTLFFLASLPLLIAAFVLAIVSLVRGKVGGGIALMVGVFFAFMMSIVTLTERDRLLSAEGRAQIIREGNKDTGNRRGH